MIEEDVLKALKQLKPKMTTGLDGVASFLLKDSTPIIFLKNVCRRLDRNIKI